MASPTTPTNTRSEKQKKPIELPQKALLQALREFRDAKGLACSNKDLFEYVGVSEKTGYRIFKDYPQRLQNPFRKETRGAKKLLGTAQIDQLVRFLRSDGGEECALPWTDLCEAAGLRFSKEPPSMWTIRRHLNDRGWKKCSTCRKYWVDYDTAACREAFAREAQAREALATQGLEFSFWRRIRYSDEVHFQFAPDGKVVIIRRSGERYTPDCIPRPAEADDRRVSLSAWAAIGWDFKSRLVWYFVPNSNGAITLQAYRDQILEPEVKRWIREGHDFILEEDGASGHGGNSDNNIVQQWKQNHGSGYFFNCPGAPDLAPIENAWRAPKGQVKRQAVWDAEALRAAAEEGWEKLSQSTINRWVEGVPGRLSDLIKAADEVGLPAHG